MAGKEEKTTKIDQVFEKLIWKTFKEAKTTPLLPFNAVTIPTHNSNHSEYVTQKHSVSMDDDMNEHTCMCRGLKYKARKYMRNLI